MQDAIFQPSLTLLMEARAPRVVGHQVELVRENIMEGRLYLLCERNVRLREAPASARSLSAQAGYS